MIVDSESLIREYDFFTAVSVAFDTSYTNSYSLSVR